MLMSGPAIPACSGLTCLALVSVVTSTNIAYAQELVPAAYTPIPVGFNILSLVGSFSKGDITFDPSLPVEDGHGTIGGAAIGFGRSMNLAGRYANIGVGVPFAKGHVQGLLAGEPAETRRSGLGDVSARVAVNLYGARAMSLKEFATYRPSTLVGVSLVVLMPTGQYDPSRIVNLGANRWTFRPEVGITRRRGSWTFEGDVGSVLFTDNTNYRNGGTRAQAPIVTFQGHVIYTVRPGLWAAFDANFWRGGRITTNGIAATELQHNSRFGATVALPIGRQQVRIAVSSGAYTRLGGDFTSIGVSYSYAWTTRRP